MSAARIDRFFTHEDCLDQFKQQKDVTFTKERVSVKSFVNDQKRFSFFLDQKKFPACTIDPMDNRATAKVSIRAHY